jgi:peptidyl-prolyl cis-trans isomerase C
MSSVLSATEEAQPAVEKGGLRSSHGARWRRLLCEPLLHFLVLGLLLFGIYSALNRGPAQGPKSNQIELTLDDLRQLQIAFAAKWQRAPTPEEMVGLVESRVREEILYREALALGLDKDDTIVKRRMAQKMEFLAQDVSATREPTAIELKAWFEKNPRRFTQSGRVTFRHLYFSPDRRGARAHDEAAMALEKLAGKPENWPRAASLADPFMFQDYLADRSPEQIAKDFGPAFATTLFDQKPGAWRGPIESGYGWHLVFVDSLTPGRVPALEEVEPDVKTAWLAEQREESWRKAYDTMRAKYEVMLPAPPSGNDVRPAL